MKGIRIKSLTKSQVRSKILLRLNAQKEEERNRKSKAIKDALFRDKAFKKAKTIMFYIAFGGEVKTKDMIKEALKLGKIIAVPVCKKNRMLQACLLGKRTQLSRGPYGTWEPAEKKSLGLKHLDLVVVPGVAFDKQGSRLGRGKGYYDRFLKKLPDKATSIGLAFDFQVLSFIPATAHDVSVNKVIFA